MADRHIGKIVALKMNYGFLKAVDAEIKLYFSRFDVADARTFRVGDNVSYLVGTNALGPCALDLKLCTPESGAAATKRGRVEDQQNYMAQAVIARDNRQFDLAERLFKRALEDSPSQQVILTFAAMEKNRGRKKEALEVYREGIKRNPGRKLYEDAGALAISLDSFVEAREFLTKGLQHSKPGTEGGLYLLLARNAFNENTNASLKEAVRYYELATKALSPASFPKGDLLSFNISRLRVQHHRGNIAFNCFSKGGFKIMDVEFLDAMTEGADLVVAITDKELTESFGIESVILVRVFFKAQVSLADIDQLAEKIAQSSVERGTDDQFCLMVTASVSDELKKVLFGRIENKNKLYPAVIPLPQETVETEQPRAALNEVFGQWLYRRDLFNVNFPVVGRRFFGRNRDLDELRDAISDSIPVGIFGLRKVGKTSLLKELARRAGDNGDIYVYLDLLRIPGDVLNFRWIYWRVASELHRLIAPNARLKRIKWRLGGSYDSFLDVPPELPVATAFDADLTSILKALQELPSGARPKVVILLDEIERLLPNSQGKEGLEGYFDFFSYLRGVSQETVHLSLVVTGANASISEVAQFQGRDNPTFNFFKQVYLRLLPSPDCNAMLTVLGRGMGIKFAKGAVPDIVSLTGGHPFFSRQFCSFLADQYRDRPLEVSEDMVRESVEKYILFCDKDMQEIFERLSRDYPEERDFCVTLATSANNKRVSAEIAAGILSGTALRHLVGYQLIELQGDHVRFTMDLLRLWLSRRIGVTK